MLGGLVLSHLGLVLPTPYVDELTISFLWTLRFSQANTLLTQPDRVMEFCNNNDLQLIVRAHECVMDGFERFAQGHLITLFSATNYCGEYMI
jgi:hypothetical protein